MSSIQNPKRGLEVIWKGSHEHNYSASDIRNSEVNRFEPSIRTKIRYEMVVVNHELGQEDIVLRSFSAFKELRRLLLASLSNHSLVKNLNLPLNNQPQAQENTYAVGLYKELRDFSFPSKFNLKILPKSSSRDKKLSLFTTNIICAKILPILYSPSQSMSPEDLDLQFEMKLIVEEFFNIDRKRCRSVEVAPVPYQIVLSLYSNGTEVSNCTKQNSFDEKGSLGSSLA